MTLIPDKLFVNLYAPGVGGNIGTAFPTRQKADECSTSHRLACLEMGTASGIPLAVPDFVALHAAAKERKTDPEKLVSAALNILLALPHDTRTQINAYCAKHGIKPHTAIAEACHCYFVEAAA